MERKRRFITHCGRAINEWRRLTLSCLGWMLVFYYTSLEHTRAYLAPTYSLDRDSFTVLPSSRGYTELKRIMNTYFALKGGSTTVLEGNTLAENFRRYAVCRNRGVSVSLDSFTVWSQTTTFGTWAKVALSSGLTQIGTPGWVRQFVKPWSTFESWLGAQTHWAIITLRTERIVLPSPTASKDTIILVDDSPRLEIAVELCENPQK